jgi:hypothetical protein
MSMDLIYRDGAGDDVYHLAPRHRLCITGGSKPDESSAIALRYRAVSKAQSFDKLFCIPKLQISC